MNTAVKLCPRCDLEKPLDDFYVNRSLASGIERTCKECTRDAQRRRQSHSLLRDKIAAAVQLTAILRDLGPAWWLNQPFDLVVAYANAARVLDINPISGEDAS